MKQVVLRPYYWFLDYVYALRYQLFSIRDHETAVRYRNNGKNVVVLIPGIYENWHFMKPVAKALYDAGYDVHVIDGLGYNRGTVEAMASLVKVYIDENKLTDIVLVTHSKGGLVAKYLLSVNNEPKTIKGAVAINAPFSGSRYAYILPFRSLRIFIPTSPILLTLAKDRIVNDQIVSIYGVFDPHIQGGSHLDGAQNVQLPVYGHFRVLNDSRVHAAIIHNVAALMNLY